ncbi:MAG: UDP-2,4-diacetamido-2,4,6-trideoxy-beta-L-altropyranose hydrolase [Pseudomonadota bacterium]
MSLTFVFRVDTSSRIGSGHLMRCLVLAECLRELNIECCFVCRDFPGNHAGRVRESGFRLEFLPYDPAFSLESWLGADQLTDAEQSLVHIAEIRPDWIVVDHYGIGAEWEGIVSAASASSNILVIDDLADRQHLCDILVDITPDRSQEDYSGLLEEKTEQCFGLDYALLRPDFIKQRYETGSAGGTLRSPAEILVTFGGGNNQHVLDLTLQAIEKLDPETNFYVTVIGNKEGITIPENLADRLTCIDFEHDMASRIAHSDIMVGAAGGTSWERCCLGVPGVVLMVAENQRSNFEAISRRNASLCVEADADAISSALNQLLTDEGLYSTISSNAWNMCDGRGAFRVKNAILSRSMEIVPATMDDARLIYDARYSDGAERYYRNPAKPDYSDHVRWMENALQSRTHNLLVLKLANEFIAHVRFDIVPGNSERAEVGIALAPESRGKGLALPALQAGAAHAKSKSFKTIDAEVHPENAASIKLFEAAGFKAVGSDEENGFRQFRLDF